MWYIMVRKDESNVLRKTPAPDTEPDDQMRKGPKSHSLHRLTRASWNLAHSFLRMEPEQSRGLPSEDSKRAISQRSKVGNQGTPAPHAAGEGRTAPTSSTSCKGREP